MDKANRKVTFEQEAKIYEEAALAEIKKTIGDGSGDPPEIACILQSGRRAIYMARQELANRVEVVHARWERKPGTKHEWWCPACKRVFPYSYTRHNYCPNCGAKMDGGNEDG